MSKPSDWFDMGGGGKADASKDPRDIPEGSHKKKTKAEKKTAKKEEENPPPSDEDEGEKPEWLRIQEALRSYRRDVARELGGTPEDEVTADKGIFFFENDKGTEVTLTAKAVLEPNEDEEKEKRRREVVLPSIARRIIENEDPRFGFEFDQ